MSRIKTPFMPDKYFHIYHKVENGRNLFPTEEYKNIFFNALNKIINPYAKIIGYCLLPDHYHLLIKVKSQLYQKNGFPNIGQLLTYYLRRFIRNYNQFVNTQEKKKGKLLSALPYITPIKDNEQMKEILVGIHLNPVYHNITEDPGIYQWSSFQPFLKQNNDNLPCEEVLNYYGGKQKFIDYHTQAIKWNKCMEP
ncbi:MAG TPA: hypothetical protein P5250_02415 [Bacteroidales bacterium]|nr:hypothetical protein [Bacteroidales bacterium]